MKTIEFSIEWSDSMATVSRFKTINAQSLLPAQVVVLILPAQERG